MWRSFFSLVFWGYEVGAKMAQERQGIERMTGGDHGKLMFFVIVLLLSLAGSSVATDEQSLLAFKRSVQDPAGVLSNWNSGSNSVSICHWTGVACDNQTLRVTNLSLPSAGLAGSISSAIGALASLQYLDLRNNSFRGSIPPEIGNCSYLQSIQLSNNRLTGEVPPTLGNLTSLVTLQLSDNRLASQIPSALGHCLELRVLDISENFLYGPIPASLGNCTKLSFLTLTNNLLSGSIPSSFGNLLQLQGLLIGSNSLSGGFPIELFQLKQKLNEVRLNNNHLAGTLPDRVDEFQALSTLDLSSNNFTGALPYSLGTAKALILLNLADNRFAGPMPWSLGSIDKAFAISLNLSNNLLTGTLTVLGNLVSTVSVDVSRNRLTGGISENVTKCLYLTYVDVSQNMLSGEIPPGMAGMHLHYLNVSYNNFTGSIDEFTGITAASFLPGNDGLCGLILNRPCPKAGAPLEAPDLGQHDSTVGRNIVLYSGGAVLVFCAFVICASWFDSVKVASTRHLRDTVTCYGRGLQMIRLTVRDLMVATEAFHERHRIGNGGTSTVYKGLLPFYPFIVAVKKFQDDEDGRQRLLKEAGILSIVRHRNVVGTLGVASIPRSLNVLVLEFVENGTLHQLLHDEEVCEVGWEVRLNIAIDVATAVSYLHEDTDQHLAIIHGDLKPANIFLDSDFSAKVGDFGLAKLLVDVDSAQRDERVWEGTFGYSPPGDVYSFGVVILEMATRRRPASLVFEDLGGSFIAWVRAAFPDKLDDIVDPSLKHAEDCSGNKEAIGLFIRVGLLCTRSSPRDRPTMSEALAMLQMLAVKSTAGTTQARVPVQSIQELIEEPAYTSFQHAKTWGWVNKDFVMDIRDSALYYDSWISIFRLDVRDSRTLKAMGFDSAAIINVRKQTKERRAKLEKECRKTSWMRAVWNALFHRGRLRRTAAEGE